MKKTVLELKAFIDYDREIGDKDVDIFVDEFLDLVEKHGCVAFATYSARSEEELE